MKTPKFPISNNNRMISMWSTANKENPQEISVWTKDKFLWICKHGHEWKTSAGRIYMGGNCPYCYGRYATKENNFALKFPEISLEWDKSKNQIDINQVSPRSGKLFHWKCSKNHTWIASPHNRSSTGQGCPYCINKSVNADNCFANSTFSYLLNEWDFEKNTVKPSDFVPGSTKKVHWLCSKRKHSWMASIKNRTQNLSGCPKCSKIELIDGECFDSQIEAYYYINLKNNGKVLGKDFLYNKKYAKTNMRFDFFLVKENKYIELTSFSKTYFLGKSYFSYLRKIVKKKQLAISMGAKFEFIQRSLNKKERLIVQKNTIFCDSSL